MKKEKSTKETNPEAHTQQETASVHTAKKILVASDCFLPRWDGVSRFLSELLPTLTPEFEVHVIAPDYGVYSHKDFTVHRIPLRKIQWGDYVPAKTPSKALLRELLSDTDVVFVQTIGPIGSQVIKVAHAMGIPVVGYAHSIEWELVTQSLSRLNPLRFFVYHFVKRYAKRLYNKCDLIIMPSGDTANLYRWNGIRTAKEIIWMGIDTEQFYPSPSLNDAKKELDISPDVHVIGFVGRLGREKDLVTLHKAFQRLSKHRQDVRLLIVGEGIRELEHLFEKDPLVLAVGSVQNVVPYLHAMDVYVLPSLTETSSLSTLEAMSCGLPVIATKVGFVRRYIQNKHNGLFFPKRNDVILGLKLEWLLNNDFVRKGLGKAARKTVVEQFSLPETLRKVKEVLLERASVEKKE